MFHLVTGGSGSGKSVFAETLICKHADEIRGTLFYIATMLPYGEETKRKILRHRIMRENKGFETIECYTNLDKLNRLEGRKAECVLLECVSNLVANELYQPDGAGIDTVDAVIRGIMQLKQNSRHLVVVTNEVCSECAIDSEEMIAYKQMISQINIRMAQMADTVTEVVYGIPVILKGKVMDVVRMEEMPDNEGAESIGRISDNGGGESIRKMPEPKIAKERIVPGMKLIIGGAYQGKLDYAKSEYSNSEGRARTWEDGMTCSFDAVYTCGGIYHFETFIRRMMENGNSTAGLAKDIAKKNPDIVIVCREIGYGLVPVDAFEREYREQVGRICTEIAGLSSRVDRIVCGIKTTLKGE